MPYEAATPRALVIDDEPGVRRLVTIALQKEGFVCDTAIDGEQGWQQSCERAYDVIVLDLSMPHRNGHSLVIDLLGRADRPLLVVLTGLLDPRLAKDLMARGVDDIVFKPVDFASFAAKVWSLVKRRLHRRRTVASAVSGVPRVADDRFAQRVLGISRLPTVSPAAIEVFKIASRPEVDLRRVAAAAQRDPALIIDILRRANSPSFNPTGQKITNFEQAVIRLGHQQVGELALATASAVSTSLGKASFLSCDQVWRECLAAGICLELLLEGTDRPTPGGDSLFCAAIVHPLARLMLAHAFTDEYAALHRTALAERRTLCEFESLAFPELPGAVLAASLESWGIPDEITLPLRHTSQSFAELTTLEDPNRRGGELVKTAGFLGKLAAGGFEGWDRVDLPSAATLQRLGNPTIETIQLQCRDDLEAIVSFGSDAPRESSGRRGHTASNQRSTVRYLRLHEGADDLMPHIFETIGVRALPVDRAPASAAGPIVVNALDVGLAGPPPTLDRAAPHDRIILTEAEHADLWREHGHVVSFPVGLATLHGTLVPSSNAVSWPAVPAPNFAAGAYRAPA